MSPRSVQLAAAAAAVTAAWLAYKIYRAVWCPPALRKLPAIPIPTFFRLLNLPFNVRHGALKRILDGTKAVRIWIFGKWAVQVTSNDYAKTVFARPDIYAKVLPGDLAGKDSIQALFFGENIVFSNGEEWRRHRRIVNPAFKKQWDTEVFADVASRMMDEWEKTSEGKPPVVNIHDWMQRLTLDALGFSIFNYDIGAVRSGPNPLVDTYHQAISVLMRPLLFFLPTLGKLLAKNAIIALGKFNQLMFDIIDQRRREVANAKEGQEFRDLISLMVIAADEDGDGPSLTKEELRSNAFIFFIAGHDTTANSLACALYFLAKHEKFQERAREEIFDIVGKDEDDKVRRVPNFEEQKRLNFLTAIIYESLRLCPSVTVLPFRTVTQDTMLGDLELKKGTLLNVNIYAINRDPRVWPRPEEFDPSRFYHANLGSRDAFEETQSGAQPGAHHHLAFGAGMRSCIGESFSLIEQRVVLSVILSKYRIELPEDSPHKKELGFKVGGLLAPKDLMLRFVAL